MPSFGEFLIERKLTTAAQLVDALIWQQQERIPVVQLVLDEQLLTPNEVLKAMDHESAQAVTFEQALLDLDLLSQSQVRELHHQHVESGPHIGQVLVAMGALREEALKSGLQAYRATLGEEEVA